MQVKLNSTEMQLIIDALRETLPAPNEHGGSEVRLRAEELAKRLLKVGERGKKR